MTDVQVFTESPVMYFPLFVCMAYGEVGNEVSLRQTDLFVTNLSEQVPRAIKAATGGLAR